jgi:hypothetical protein
MAAKRPTGELPKRLSKLAAVTYRMSAAEGKKNQITPSAAAAATGAARDRAKAAANKPVKITGTATSTKTTTAAKANAMTKNGMKMGKRSGSK